MNCFREHWLVVDKTSFLIGLVFDNTKGLIRLLYLTTTKNFSKLSKEETIMRAHTMVHLIHQPQALRAKERGDSIPDISFF